MVLDVDLNNPPPRFENDFFEGSSIINVNTDLELALPQLEDVPNTNLELALPQVELPNPSVDDDVLICSPRSFEEARSRSRRNRRVITNLHGEDAESQRGQSERSGATSSRQRRGPTRRRNDGGNQQCRQDIKKGKGISMSQDASQYLPPSKMASFTCPICMGAFDEEVSTKCGHIFCRKCITSAIEIQGKCPTCRRKLKSKDMFRIYLPNSQ